MPNVKELLSVMDESHVEAAVNLDGLWGDELEANLDRYDRRHPGRFFTFCQIEWERLARDGVLAESRSGKPSGLEFAERTDA